MNKFIINLKNGVDGAGPFVNKYNQNFDSIRFFIDDDMDFSSCHFAIAVSAFDKVCMISEDDEKLVRGTDDERLCLDWTLGTEVTSTDGVIIYQVIAYTSDENGTVNAIWYSPEGRIFVGDSIDTTDYEVSQIGAEPGILMQILSNVSLCKDNTDANKKSIDSLSFDVSNHEDRIYFNETSIEKNQEDIKSVNSALSDISVRLSVDEELTQKNALDIAYNSSLIAENGENISLANSQISLLRQELFMSSDSISKIREDVDDAEYNIAQIKTELSDCNEKILKNEENIALRIDRENNLEEQILNVSDKSGANEIAIDAHNSDISNPHKVSASQIGLGNVDNTSDMDKPVSNATKEALDNISDRIDGLGDSLFNYRSESLDYHKESQFYFPYENYILNKSGGLTARDGMAVSDYIDLKGIGQIYKYGGTVLVSVYPHCFYDENYNLIKYCDKYVPEKFETINDYSNSIEYMLLEGARYIRITHEMERIALKYFAVPKRYEYKVDATIVDKYSQFLFHTQDTTVNFGDSIFGNNNTITGISNLISYNMGTTVYNCAFGGTRLAVRGSSDTGYDKFDFSTLVDSIISGDYSVQESAIDSFSLPSYYRDRLDFLKTVDFNKVNTVTLNHASNDYTGGTTPARFKQKYIEIVEKIQTAFPHINVVLITPTWRFWLNEDNSFKEDGNTAQYGGYTLLDYVNAVEEVSKELNVPYIDVYNIGINKYNWSNFFSTSDTTHQNENGRRKIAQVISRALTQIA